MRKRRAVLTEQEKADIVALYKKDVPPAAVAVKFDITPTTVSRVLKLAGVRRDQRARNVRPQRTKRAVAGRVEVAQEALAKVNGNGRPTGPRFLVNGYGSYVACNSLRHAVAAAHAALLRGEGAPEILRVEPVKYKLAIKLERRAQ